MALKDKTLEQLLDYGRGVAFPTTLEAELLDRLEQVVKEQSGKKERRGGVHRSCS